MAVMARCALFPSINPPHSFRHQFPQSNASFCSSPTLPNFLRFRRCGFSGGNRRRGGVTMAAGSDHYSTLKVSRNATLQEIKSAYRKLARKVTLGDSRLLFILPLIFLELKLRVCNFGTVSPRYEQEPWCRR